MKKVLLKRGCNIINRVQSILKIDENMYSNKTEENELRKEKMGNWCEGHIQALHTIFASFL